ncbi:MAG: AAA family ATPase [Cohaesibacter sp.]|jgi:exonuclease SbcC|nr:AAA family ATPase [Cohaesibacter sp.]
MDILRIQGENIASLAKPFDIDFSNAPLSGSGLFAITGDTGSGKSSLLDALCLALYGNCPRLGASGVNDQVPDISGEMLQSSDARTILRRGASDGYAMVTFRSIDGNEYEARWSARRSRGNATGRLQGVERSVTRLSDGVVLENQKKSVTTKIEQLTGLTYDEFRRSVLLAQGDFDSFLSAKTSDRAKILEKITDTHLYRDISKRAYEAFSAADSAVESLETRLGEHKILDAEEKTALDQQDKSLSDASQQAKSHKVQLGRDLDRYKALEDAQDHISLAEKAVGDAQKAQMDAQEEVGLLSRLKRAASLKTEWQEESNATVDLCQLRQQLQDTSSALAQAREVEATAATQAAQKAENSDQLEAEFKALGSQWDKAARLDSEISSAAKELEQASFLHTSAKADFDEKQKAVTDSVQTLAAAQTRMKQLKSAMDAEPAAQIFSNRWAILEDRLKERIKACKAVVTARAETLDLERSLMDQTKRKTEIEISAGQSQTEIDTAQKAIDSEDGQRRALRNKAPSRRLARLNISLSAVQAMLRTVRDYEGTKLQISQIESQIAGCHKAILDNEQAISSAQEAIIRQDGIIEALQASTEVAEAAISQEAANLRLHLIDGEPCPVCGSQDHPVHASQAAAKMAKDLRDRLDAASTTRQHALDQATKAHAAIDAAKADIQLAKERLNDHSKAVSDYKEAYAKSFASEVDGPLEDKLPARPDGAIAELLALISLLEEWQSQLEADCKELEALEHSYQSCQQTIEQQTAIKNALARELEDIRQATGSSDKKRAILAQTIEEKEARLRLLDEELTRDFSSITNDWNRYDHDGEGYLRDLSARKDAFLTSASAFEHIAEDTSKSAGLLEKVTLALDSALAIKEKAEAALKTRESAHAHLLAERAGLLGGQETGLHRTAFNERRMKAHKALETARKDHSNAQTHLSGLEARAKSETLAIDKAVQRQEDAREALHAVIAQSDLTFEDVGDLLAWDSAKVDSLSAKLEKLEQAKASALTLFETRKKDHQALLQKGLPKMDKSEIETIIVKLDAEEDVRQLALGEVRTKLAMDKLAREKQAKLITEIDAAKMVRDTWSAIKDVIGSANGDKFAEIAQSVTLGVLVDHANHYLKDIKPRYRLALGDGKLSLHVVDDYMAGEVRSTRSLSGGERFLISLALALALSTIGGRGSLASMLFIDEGFGTLDADSLEMAINALEALQAQGRTIGVISHVQAMKDRIPVQIRIKPQGGGESEVQLVTG